MSLWLARSGKHGEFEQKFLDEGRIYMTWEGLDHAALAKADDRDSLFKTIAESYPKDPTQRVRNWWSQIAVHRLSMKKGDYVVMPLKRQAAVAIGTVQSDYIYDAKAPEPFKHYREVKWLDKAVPRSRFDQDLLYSFGAFMTFCEIKRDNAKDRVLKVLGKPTTRTTVDKEVTEITDETASTIDIEQLAQDALAKTIIRKFKGHGLERLVEAVLRAQGYSTFHSPKGADGGVDILAASGNLGFGEQRICVQVKSSDSAVDSPTLDQLIGAMQKVKASHGLLVAWGGFKQSVEAERARQFFNVRLWGQRELIEQIQQLYDKLDDEIKAELPLKRIWVVAEEE